LVNPAAHRGKADENSAAHRGYTVKLQRLDLIMNQQVKYML